MERWERSTKRLTTCSNKFNYYWGADIFIKPLGWLPCMEEYALNIVNVFPLFKKIYDSEDEILSFFLKFQRNYTNPKQAYHEFLTLNQYFLGLLDIDADSVKLVMFVSLIEKLTSDRRYLSFSEWIVKNELQGSKAKVLKLWNKYNEEFGCNRKFRNFFTSPKYFRKSEKLMLLGSIYYDNGKHHVPMFCYNEKLCGASGGYHFDGCLDNCPISNNERLLRKSMNEFGNFLYELRNTFVHNASFFNFCHSYKNVSVIHRAYVSYRFRFVSNPTFTGEVDIFLDSEFLNKTIRRVFKGLLWDYRIN